MSSETVTAGGGVRRSDGGGVKADPTDRLTVDLGRLMTDQDTADVTFIVGPSENRVSAHKLVMWSRCQPCQRHGREMWRKQLSLSANAIIKMPTFTVENFRNTINYIYTGKVELTDHSVFEVLTISQEFGLDQLRHMCEDYIINMLNIANACMFYMAASKLPEATDSSGNVIKNTLAERCMDFICQNADVCSKTDGFQRLQKKCLIKIISQDEFSMDESDVWRAVLAWAKHQSKLTTPISSWSTSDKELIKEHLSDVICHVRLLLIDSKVFANEVEPTGAVPMQLSLERYRCAAVPTAFNPQTDVRLRPRSSNKMFHGTAILSQDKVYMQKILNEWFGSLRQDWCLLYRASRDGFTADSFHEHCDNHTPTFILIQGNNGNICGGFTDVPWTDRTPRRGQYCYSKGSFLFTLINQGGIGPTKFPVSNPRYATCHHPKYGPMFGAGADLCLSDGCNESRQSYSNFPHSYTAGDNVPANIMFGDYHFNVLDYEVFTVRERSPIDI